MTDLIAVQKIAGWEKLKTLVLDSVSSPITKRVYNMALDEFLGWFQQAPRPGFTKATVSAWRVSSYRSSGCDVYSRQVGCSGKQSTCRKHGQAKTHRKDCPRNGANF